LANCVGRTRCGNPPRRAESQAAAGDELTGSGFFRPAVVRHDLWRFVPGHPDSYNNLLLITDGPMTEKRSFLTRAWLGFWRTLDLTRRIFLNVIFFLFLYLVFVLFLKPDEPLRVNVDTTLVLRPYGFVVEQYSGSPVDRALQQATSQAPEETRLRDLVEAVERAAADEHITQLVIDPDYLWGIGLASLRDLEEAIIGFKATGKPVVAVADMLSEQQYYLAALADEIWLNPDGIVWIDGFSNYRNFYREGLDRLDVEINLFRVGEYKSAMEPYVRDDMSAEAKEAARFWLDDLWLQYLEGVSRHRGIPVQTMTEAIDDLAARLEAVGGNFAEFALQLGLVDQLMTAPEARQELARRGAPNEAGDSFRAVGVDTYLQVTQYMKRKRAGNHVAVVVAEGTIRSGQQSTGAVGSESIAAQLRAAGRNDDYQAVVLRINSPGGESFASEVIRREIQSLRDLGKTVVVSMGDVAASGGYWIAMAADEVWANPATITGSIGVYGILPTFGGTLDKIGIHTDGVGTTRLAGKLRLDRPLDPELRRIFQSSTEKVYEDFISLVSVERSLERAQVEEVARGRVWSGAQAAGYGLVDRLGTLKDAIDAAARIAGLGTDYDVRYVEPELSPLENFILELTTSALAQLKFTSMTPTFVRQPLLQSLLRDLAELAQGDRQLTIAAHCLCGMR
jgi:protease-4